MIARTEKSVGSISMFGGRVYLTPILSFEASRLLLEVAGRPKPRLIRFLVSCSSDLVRVFFDPSAERPK